MSQEQLRFREVPWEGSWRQDLGLDEQESDMRLFSLGKGAMDSEARYTLGSGISSSGEAKGQWCVLPREICPGVHFGTTSDQGRLAEVLGRLDRSQQRP